MKLTIKPYRYTESLWLVGDVKKQKEKTKQSKQDKARVYSEPIKLLMHNPCVSPAEKSVLNDKAIIKKANFGLNAGISLPNELPPLRPACRFLC